MTSAGIVTLCAGSMADGGTVDMAHARWVEGLPPEPTGKLLSLFG